MKRRTTLSQNQGNGEPEAAFRPQLTSLIDVMTILLVFLIQNFSVEGNLVTPSKDLHLPESSALTKPEQLITVQITGDKVLVDDQIVEQVSTFATSSDFMIKSLFERMKLAKDAGVQGKVMLEADRELPFNIVKRVAYTCSQAGFTDFSVLVYQEEK